LLFITVNYTDFLDIRAKGKQNSDRLDGQDGFARCTVRGNISHFYGDFAPACFYTLAYYAWSSEVVVETNLLGVIAGPGCIDILLEQSYASNQRKQHKQDQGGCE
jgi:hypothetical protein